MRIAVHHQDRQEDEPSLDAQSYAIDAGGVLRVRLGTRTLLFGPGYWKWAEVESEDVEAIRAETLIDTVGVGLGG